MRTAEIATAGQPSWPRSASPGNQTRPTGRRAAALEYAAAVLVAVVEGHRDQAYEDHALAKVKKRPGEARRQLKQLADAHRDRSELMGL
jgi:hypothetical protein